MPDIDYGKILGDLKDAVVGTVKESAGKFLDENKDFSFSVGEVGMFRPCVGIIQNGTGEYVAYQVHDEAYQTIADCKAAWSGDRPETAYHKHPCFAVLIHDVDSNMGPTDAQKRDATADLDRWLGAVMAAGYRIHEYQESAHTIGALMYGGTRTLKAVVDAGKRPAKRKTRAKQSA